jgi:sulfhydrogenase subunit beta (sulfur reductase)
LAVTIAGNNKIKEEQAIRFLAREDLDSLIKALQDAGYRCVGPQVKDGAIVYDTLVASSQLPRGYRDIQSPGRYQLEQADDPRYFAWANGPQAIKPLTFASRESMWRCQRDADGAISFTPYEPGSGPVAVIGARACDLAALYIQDQHFLHTENKDPYYLARRQQLFLVAVNCTHAAATCFCASTGDGPQAKYGYDIALSELDEGFIVEGRSDRGLDLMQRLPTSDINAEQVEIAAGLIQQAAQQQRQLPSRNLKELLFQNLEHERWQTVGERCLSCGNCTSVCPTCFCHREDESAALDGSSSEHFRQWDSCFTQGHSYIHGITIRADTAKRYRQWLTHKLGSWHDQYGRSGCVGCGRCISWCPVGIDLTEEVAAIGGEANDGEA